METKEEEKDDSELRCQLMEEEEHVSPKDETVLQLLDSISTYLHLMDSLSSNLRQGWIELASARHSMGSSRVSSALFDLKYHHAATSMEVDHRDADSNVKQPHFTLHKWASVDNQEFCSEEAKFEEDELLQRQSSSPHNKGASLSSEHQEKRPENNGPEVLSSPNSPCSPGNHIQKERAKSISVFGTLVSPKLRAAQLSFETVLETLQEVANVRSSMLSAYEQVLKEMEIPKI